MAFKDRVCCICNEHKKFLGRINAGQKLYCMKCEVKITKEYGTDYWKPCSQLEFFEAMLSRMKKGNNKKENNKKRNMLTGLKEQFKQFEEEAKNKEKK